MYKSEQNVCGDTLFDSAELELDNLFDWSNITNPILLSQEEIVLENQEDTMDASTKFNLLPKEYIPVSPRGPPEREIFSGDLKFEISICGADTNKSKFMYSHLLNRIYVYMGHGFSVQLKWDVAAQPHPAMFVRATPVFADQAQAEKRVTRCIQHYHENINDESMSEAMRWSVLLSTRDAGTRDVFYCGAQATPDVWYSVVVRFAAPSTHAYQFACKNSCSSGINRRTTAIIFTLEDHTGKVYGRQSVGARACSCPKRDKNREEEEEAPRGKGPLAAGRRSAPAAVAAPRAKKIKLEVRHDEADSDEVLQLPPISIVGRRVYNTGLSVMLSMLEEKRAMAARGHQPTEQLDASIAQLRQHLDRPGDEHNHAAS